MALMNKKKFKLFDPMRDGKGVEKGEDTTPTLGRFFKLWKRKFWYRFVVDAKIYEYEHGKPFEELKAY